MATHLNEHYDYYRELLARHGVRISNERIGHDLRNFARLGDDEQTLKSALVSDGSLHSAPAGLAQTLAELERLLTRLEGRATSKVTVA